MAHHMLHLQEENNKYETLTFDILVGLLQFFPDNFWLLKTLVKQNYDSSEHANTLDICLKLRELDPYRMDFTETLSHL